MHTPATARPRRAGATVAPALSGRTALVTGASGGIGREVAMVLASRGARLVLHGRNEPELARLAADTGGTPLVADLTDPAGRDLLAARAAAFDVDVLVCSAGVGWRGAFADIPPTEIDRLVTVDLLEPVRLVRRVLPGMLERGRGHVVLVSSIAGHTGVAGEAVYSAAKAGLSMFGGSLGLELAGSGVAVTVVVPGVVDTGFFARRGVPYQRRRPRPVPPRLVADAVVRGIEVGRPEVVVPRWLTLPMRVRGALPGTYRRLAGRFG